jgi:hypothetical protein
MPRPANAFERFAVDLQIDMGVEPAQPQPVLLPQLLHV